MDPSIVLEWWGKVAKTQRNLTKLVQGKITNNQKTLSVFKNIF